MSSVDEFETIYVPESGCGNGCQLQLVGRKLQASGRILVARQHCDNKICRALYSSATTVRPRSFLSPEQTTITGSSSANYKPIFFRNHIDPCLATKINHSKHRVIFIPCPFVFPVLSFFFCRKSNLTTVCGRMNGTTQVRARARFCHDHPTSIVAWN